MLLETIRRSLAQLPLSERRVGEVILAQPGQAVDESIKSLARTARVSEPTVLRFCRSMGFGGWQEFKLKLAQSLALALPAEATQPQASDVAADLVEKICARSVNTLLDLRQSLRPEVLQRAVETLAKAHRIEIYGQGTSGIVAKDAQHKFFRSGVPTVAYSDPSVHAIASALLGKDDAVVAFSQHGNTAAVLQSVRAAKKNKAKVIAVAPTGTPLMALADVAIAVDQPAETDPYTPLSGRLAHLVVVDILAVGLAIRLGPAFRKRMQDAQDELRAQDVKFETFLAR